MMQNSLERWRGYLEERLCFSRLVVGYPAVGFSPQNIFPVDSQNSVRLFQPLSTVRHDNHYANATGAEIVLDHALCLTASMLFKADVDHLGMSFVEG